MARTQPINPFTLWLLIGIAVFAVTDAQAQTLYQQESSTVVLEGEPTDPEGALLVPVEFGVELESLGIRTSAPQAEADRQLWWEELVALLRAFGILPPEEPGS